LNGSFKLPPESRSTSASFLPSSRCTPLISSTSRWRRCCGVTSGTLTAQRGEEALEDLRGLPLNRYPHDFLIPRVWELRATLTAYDALYVALAELLGAVLLTCDGKIASASGHHASVEVV
jgi:predicted nucleic acid-binding protein